MKLFHPQFEQLLDRKTGVQFVSSLHGDGTNRATADVPPEQVPDFLARGYQAVNPEEILPLEPVVATTPLAEAKFTEMVAYIKAHNLDIDTRPGVKADTLRSALADRGITELR